MTQQHIIPRDAADRPGEAALRREIEALRTEIEHLRGSEASLREAEDRYRRIAEQSSDLISSHRADGVFMYASHAATSILGYEPHELIGMRVMDLIHPDDQQAALAEYDTALAAGLPHATVVCRIRRKGGDYVWIESTDRFMRDEESGAVTMFHAVTRDITARKIAEDALRASEERFRALAEQSRDLISRHGLEGAFTYASSAARSLLGYEPEELLGTHPREFVHPDDLDHVVSTVSAAMAGGPSTTFAFRFRHHDGHYVWFESTNTIARDAEGAITSFHAVSRDISERKVTEDALRASEERFRALAEQSQDLISRHTPDGTFTYASSAARSLLGYEPEQLVGRKPREFVHPDDVAGVISAIATALTGAPSTTIACRIRRADQRYIWVESINGVTRDADGGVTGVHSVTRDITARKVAEDALRTSEERFRQVFELSRVGIAFVSEDRRFLRVNRALCELVEYSEEELLSRTFADLTHPDDMELSNQKMEEAYGGQSHVGLEKRYITKTGRTIWVGVNATVMPGKHESGDPTRYTLSIFEDITHRKAAEEELRRLTTLKSEFLALASHELRAPLTNMNGGIEVIGDDAALLPPASRRALAIVSSETLRLNRLVESILDISRLDAGQLPLVLGPVALEPLLRRAAESTEFAHRVDVWVAYGLPFAWADEVYLEHIVRNVLSNAAKYTSERIAVTASGDRHRLRITIMDRGPGIPADEQSRIFDPFFRGARTDDGVAGYGLGLYFSRRMIEAQGGSISVRSPALNSEGAPGAAFDIQLPAAAEVD